MTERNDHGPGQLLAFALPRMAGAATDGFFRECEVRFDLARPELLTLAKIGEEASVLARDVARQTGMPKTAVSRAVAVLTARALVARGSDPRDGRNIPLVLTPGGRAVYDALLTAARRHDATLAARLSPAEIAGLRAAARVLPGPPPDRRSAGRRVRS